MESECAAQVSSIFEFSKYTLKDWAQFIAAVLGIVVSIVGAWKAWRFSKPQIVNRLFEHLNTDEKHVIEGRRSVLSYLRNGNAAPPRRGVELHTNIKKAIQLVAEDRHVEAEEVLNGFALYLRGSAEVGRRHTDVASQQAATILLFAGHVAKQRKDPPSARKAFEEALEHYPDDAEVLRSLGEIDLRASRFPEAHRSFDAALGLALNDKRLEAEIWSLKAEAYQLSGDAKAYPNALLGSAAAYAEIEERGMAGDAYARAGDAQLSLRHTKRARQSYRRAFDCYQRLGNVERMIVMRDRLLALKADLSDLPPIEETASRQTKIPWPWVRLAIELLILAIAAGLFYFSLR